MCPNLKQKVCCTKLNYFYLGKRCFSLQFQDYSKLIEETLATLLTTYSAETVRRPVQCIGLQVGIKKGAIKFSNCSLYEFYFKIQMSNVQKYPSVGLSRVQKCLIV